MIVMVRYLCYCHYRSCSCCCCCCCCCWWWWCCCCCGGGGGGGGSTLLPLAGLRPSFSKQASSLPRVHGHFGNLFRGVNPGHQPQEPLRMDGFQGPTGPGSIWVKYGCIWGRSEVEGVGICWNIFHLKKSEPSCFEPNPCFVIFCEGESYVDILLEGICSQ